MSHSYFKYYNYPPWETIFGFPNHDLKLSLCDRVLSLFVDLISSSYMKLPIFLKQIEMQICVSLVLLKEEEVVGCIPSSLGVGFPRLILF